MSDGQDGERARIEERLRKLDRWRVSLDRNPDKLDIRMRERLARKIERERATLENRLPVLENDPDREVSDTGAAPGGAERPPGETPGPEGSVEPRPIRSRRRRWIIAASIFAGVVIAGGIGSLLLDSHAESAVEERVRTVIDEFELHDQIAYSRIEVDTVRGRIRFFDVSFRSANPHSRLEAEELHLELSPDELVRLSWDLEGTEITRARVSLIDGSASDDSEGIAMGFEEVAAGFRGSVVLETIENPETVQILEVDGLLAGFWFRDAGAGLTTRIGEAGYTLSADVTVAELERGSLEPWEYLHELEGHLSGVGFDVSDENLPELEELQGMFGPYAWIGDPENWSIDDSGFRLTFDPDGANIESVWFASPLLDIDGTMQVMLDPALEPQRITGELSVNELHSDIRAVSRMYLAFLGQDVPSEGPFSLGFDIPEHGEPRFEIR